MSVLGSMNKTLLDVAKETDPDGKLSSVIELLTQQNAILDDIPWVKCNNKTSHKTNIRTGLPSAIWRKMYQGVPPDKSTRAVITDTCGMLEARSEIDKALADLNGNANAYRLQEDMAFLEGMNQEFSKTLFYGSEVKRPETFTGLAPRYSDATAPNGENILCEKQNASGNTNASIWLLAWDERTMHGIYPDGHVAGFHQENLGVQDSFDGSGNRFRAYHTLYQWSCGFTLRDWRYGVRSIFDTASLAYDVGNGADLAQMMEIMQERIQSLDVGKLAFYMNKKTAEFLRMQLGEKAKYQLTRETVAGKKVTTFGGIPIRICEALTNTEAKVKTA